MRATGIVRRIDDLGRVVIPKEIRKTLRIREGDPLEIFTAKDGEVILKKYSPIGELNEFSQEYAETLGEILGQGVVVTDLDSIIAVSKLPKKDYKEKSISNDLEQLIEILFLFFVQSRYLKVWLQLSLCHDIHQKKRILI